MGRSPCGGGGGGLRLIIVLDDIYEGKAVVEGDKVGK